MQPKPTKHGNTNTLQQNKHETLKTKTHAQIAANVALIAAGCFPEESGQDPANRRREFINA
eukprot:1634053-Lingulodinium_polyedra.AAC.1